ncbi:MAG: DNA helicase UvrD [Candidatus Sungbacteria bacterium]|nr:DNA helicase UvrD [Candidatus Sungbacteria bacterium]
MKIIADLHIHSPYSRAVSKQMTLENLDYWAGLKGITVMGTGDFTHPAWIKEIKKKLEPAEQGLYMLKSQISNDKFQKNSKHQNQDSKTRFLLTVEISSIYSKGGKARRIHSLLFAPSIAAAEKINTVLNARGNIKSDGRPILGIDPKELLKIALDADPECVLVPAHIWTPWFALFGSKSGFDTIEECFEEYTKHIFALETGLSSDPAMNWRLSALDRFALMSNSDSHSLRRIGREANILDTSLSYRGIMDAFKTKDKKKFLSTVEFFPEEGMYHYDGHRVCSSRLTPDQTKKLHNLCPVCGKPVTVGVVNRVSQLADRPEGVRPANAIPYLNMVPLDEIIAEARGVKSAINKGVQEEYLSVVQEFGTEFAVLYDVSPGDLKARLRPEITEGIMAVREGRLHIEPGYDGQYGTVKIFEKGEV